MELDRETVVKRVTQAVACPAIDGEIIIMPPETAMALASHIAQVVLGEKEYIPPRDDYPIGGWGETNA